MTRGDQRERDRERARKRLEQLNKSKNSEGNAFKKRQEHDAEVMRLKQQKAREKKAAETAGASDGKK